MKPNKIPLLEWLKNNAKTIASLLASLLLAVITALTGITLATSCGSTVKALVQSPKDSSTTTITITTNNPTQVSPDTDIPVTLTPKQN